jgi:hypothetical protein
MIVNMPISDISDDMVEMAMKSGYLNDALAGNIESIKSLEDLFRGWSIKKEFDDIINSQANVSSAFNNMAGGAEGFAQRLNEAMKNTKLGDYFNEDTSKEIGAYFDGLV